MRKVEFEFAADGELFTNWTNEHEARELPRVGEYVELCDGYCTRAYPVVRVTHRPIIEVERSATS